MFIEVVNRYHERLTFEYDDLKEALAGYESEHHFFIGVLDTESLTAYVPRVTAIGYSSELAIEELEEATGLKVRKVEKF
jgi:hypothetical protein